MQPPFTPAILQRRPIVDGSQVQSSKFRVQNPERAGFQDPGHPKTDRLSGIKEIAMTRLLGLSALFLFVPGLAMAQTTPPPSGTPSSTPPKAQKMASDDVLALLEKGEVFFLDVREPKELEELGTFEGYVNIPLGQIEKRLAEIPKDKAIITA
jgi:hypothetical protein